MQPTNVNCSITHVDHYEVTLDAQTKDATKFTVTRGDRFKEPHENGEWVYTVLEIQIVKPNPNRFLDVSETLFVVVGELNTALGTEETIVKFLSEDEMAAAIERSVIAVREGDVQPFGPQR